MLDIFRGLVVALIVGIVSATYKGFASDEIIDINSFLIFIKSHKAVMHMLYAFGLGLLVYSFSYWQYRRKRMNSCRALMWAALAKTSGGKSAVRITLLKSWHLGKWKLSFTVYARCGLHDTSSFRLMIRRRHGVFPGLVGLAVENDGCAKIEKLPTIPTLKQLREVKSIDAFDPETKAAIRIYMEKLGINRFKTLTSLSLLPHRAFAGLIIRDDKPPWGTIILEENGSHEEFSSTDLDIIDALTVALSATFV